MYGCRQSQCKLLCRPTVVGTAEPDADTCWKRRGKRRIDVWKIYFCKFRACRETVDKSAPTRIPKQEATATATAYTGARLVWTHASRKRCRRLYLHLYSPQKKHTHKTCCY